MPPKKIKKKLLKPRKYWEYKNLDIEKMRMERYFMPVDLQQTKAIMNPKQVDKKVYEYS